MGLRRGKQTVSISALPPRIRPAPVLPLDPIQLDPFHPNAPEASISCSRVGAESDLRRASPESGLGGLGDTGGAARVLLAGLVEPGLHARLPILAEMVAVEDCVREGLATG